jgi:serine/threonine-protein kinase
MGGAADDSLRNVTAADGTPFLLGSYRLEHPLGSGGMSSVFLATHIETGLQVALKVLPRSLAKNETLLRRFLREAKIAEALEHPNIVAIYDRGTEQGRYYLALEHIAGGDLHEWVRQHGPLPVAMAVNVLRGVARGLAHAADQGLIHRDIKPANILLTTDGIPKVADLGLAVQMEQEDERVTRDGTTVGTVDYMSPEQARDSRATSVRSDMYSLGCTIYHLLAGVPPFTGGTVPDKLRRHAQEAPPDLRALRPDVPPSLARIVRTLLAKRPEARYAGYPELIAALDAVRLDESSHDGPLYALIEDDDQDDDVGLVPDEPADRPPSATSGTFLLADDDDDLQNVATGPPKGGTTVVAAEARRSPRPATDRPDSAGPDISMAELAALDDNDADASARPRWGRGRSEPSSIPIGGMTTLPAPRATAAPARGSSGRDLHESIVRGLMIGGAVAIVGILIVTLLRSGSSGDDQAEPGDDDAIAATSDADADPNAPPRATTASTADPDRGSRARPPVPPAVPPAPPWAEPTEPVRDRVDAPPLPAPLVAAFLPEWARPSPASPPPATARIARLGSNAAEHAFSSIAAALAGSDSVIELADDGPLPLGEVAGLEARPHHLRAAQGRRPIVVLTAPAVAPGGRAPTALITIDGPELILEGLHLVVPSGSLPSSIGALFACRGGTLRLRDCTVTVFGPADRRLTLARLEEPLRSSAGSSRLVLERTWVEGPALTIADLLGSTAEVVADGSALLTGDAHAVIASLPAAGRTARRSLVLVRAVVATGRSLIRTAAGATLTVRCLGTTPIHSGAASGSPLVLVTGEPAGGDVTTPVDWAGDLNCLIGWEPWLAIEPRPDRPLRTAVADLDAARAKWRGQEDRSVSSPASVLATPRGDGPGAAASLAALLPPLATTARATLDRVAVPPANLAARSIDRLEPLPTPPAPPDSPPPCVVFVRYDIGSAATGASGGAGADLGRFLAARLATRTTHAVAIRVTGQGRHAMTPVAVPEGVSLWIEVDPASAASADPPRWFPAPGSPADSPLLDLRRADLVLRRMRLERPADAPAAPLVRVTDGRIDLADCRLRAESAAPSTTPGADPAAGALIVLTARTTRPLPPVWTAPDPTHPPRPDDADPNHSSALRLHRTILTTPGPAVAAELARGIVLATESAIASGADAFVLRPAPGIAAQRFVADLQLDRVTLAVARSVVQALPTDRPDDPGPDRPWLIASRNCVFSGAAPADPSASPDAAILRGEPGTIGSGNWLWQSDDDRYALAHDVASGHETSAVAWPAFWGRAHIRNPIPLAPPTQFAGGPRLDLAAPPAPEALRLTPALADSGAPDPLFDTPRPPPTPTAPAAKPQTPARPRTSPPAGQPF